MEIKEPKEKTAQQALEALMNRCARAEVCISDARRLMTRWRVPVVDFEGIIDRLVKEKFIDEERYAEAFVRDKLSFSRWGARKISEALYQKRIPAAVIARAMEQVESGSMQERLEIDLRRKMSGIKADNIYKLKEKLIRFGISRGFDMETVIDTVNRLVGNDD